MSQTEYRNGASVEDHPTFNENPPMLTRSTFTEQNARGEVDTQISTAKRFPRSIKQFHQKSLSLATLDEETAASCFYTLPRDGKNIEGPSARLAEIVATSWGNIRATANIVDDDGSFIIARGVCWDLENNVAVSVDVRRRITTKNGKRFSDDMIGVTANAACSIALRNAVFKVVPMALVRPIYLQARKVAIGDASTLSDRREKLVARFKQMGVSVEQLMVAIEKPGQGVEDITLDDYGTLIGIGIAIKEGTTSIDEAFPPLETKKPTTKTRGDAFADSITGQASDTKKPETQKPNEKKADKRTQPETHSEPAKAQSAMSYDALNAAIKGAKTLEELQQLMDEISMSMAAGEITSDGATKLGNLVEMAAAPLKQQAR